MLGHRDIRTTMQFYAGLEGDRGRAPLRGDAAGADHAAAAAAAPGMTGTPARRPASLPAARGLAGGGPAGLAGGDGHRATCCSTTGRGRRCGPAPCAGIAAPMAAVLAWLAEQGLLDPGLPAGARATPAAVAAYVADPAGAERLRHACWCALQSLAVVLRWLTPEQARPWLRAHPGPAGGHGPAGARQAQPAAAAPTSWCALGCRLMAQAEAGAGLRPRVRARLYRDGLMIACPRLPAAAARPTSSASSSAGSCSGAAAAGGSRSRPRRPRPAAGVAALPRAAGAGAGGISRALAAAARQRPAGSAAPARPCGSPSRAAASARTMPICASPATPGRRSAARSTRIGSAMPLATTVAIDSPEQVGIVTPLLGHRAPAPPSATTTSPAAWKPPPPGTTPSPASPTRVETAERRDRIREVVRIMLAASARWSTRPTARLADPALRRRAARIGSRTLSNVHSSYHMRS